MVQMQRYLGMVSSKITEVVVEGEYTNTGPRLEVGLIMTLFSRPLCGASINAYKHGFDNNTACIEVVFRTRRISRLTIGPFHWRG